MRSSLEIPSQNVCFLSLEGLRKRRMTGGKDEEKPMGPLFPRLHINDAEKGGPRAPPRNKMALYEQLNIPSQRFTAGSASMLPLAPNNSGSSVPSTSYSHGKGYTSTIHCIDHLDARQPVGPLPLDYTDLQQGGGQRGSLCLPICNLPVSSPLAERLHSYSSGGINLNTTSTNLEWRPMKLTKYHALNAAGLTSIAANCSSFQPHSISDSKNYVAKKLGDEDDFRVPTFVQSGRTLNCVNREQNMDKEKLTASSPNKQLQTASVKQLKRTSTDDLMSRQHMRNQTEENSKISPSFQDHVNRPASIFTNGDKVLGLLADASSSPLAGARISESVKAALVSLNEENRSSSVDDSNRLHDSKAKLHNDYRVLQEKKSLRDGVSAEPKKAVGKRNASTLEVVSCSRLQPGENRRNPNWLENASECHEDQCRPLRVGVVDKNADISDNSIVDSISEVDISPDDVVGVIGQKQFWKARRAIVHQQRVFTVQVFELHRVIKVQRLFAASPDLLLESKLYLGKPSIKVLPVKKLPSEKVLEAPPLIVELKDDPQKPNTECAAENALGNPPLPSLNSDTNKGLNSQQSNYKPCSANPPPASTATDAKPAPWCFQPPPGNQWLVPVMSPSEGLVYKPYTGPRPPTSGFMAPLYGSYGPMSLTPSGRDFLNTAYGSPASHQQGIGILSGTPPLGQTYFLPYGMPLMNPSVSSSAVEQVSPFARARSNGQENHLMGDINITMSSLKSGVNSYCATNLRASKESEVQGSRASSPSERVQAGDALPLFPTAPTAKVMGQHVQTHGVEQRTRVIRVVPHNPRSASDSAARIFRSIQEERRQYY